MPDETPDAAALPPVDAAVADDAALPVDTTAIHPDNGNVESAPDPESSGREAVTVREAMIPAMPDPATFREATAPEVPEPAALREAAASDVPAPMAFQEAAVPDVAAVAATPWPADEPSDAPAGHGTGEEDAAAFSPAPTAADWRQLADEVRRLSAQIAHGRA